MHFIHDPRTSQHNAHHPEMRAMLGLGPKAKLPIAGLPPRLIQGFTVWVDPLPMPNPTRFKRSTHRVRALCPHCKRTMSAGRLHQHRCTA